MERVKQSGALLGITFLRLVMVAVLIVLQWMVSDLMYSWGLWPIGALLRIFAWLEALGLLFATLIGIGMSVMVLIRPLDESTA
jgi:hypothetical protein